MSSGPVRAAGIAMSELDLARIKHHAGITAVESLDGYESLIYRSLDPADRILRVTHDSRRTAGNVRAEATLLAALADAGVSVAAPIGDDPVFEEVLENGDRVVCLVTQIAPGTIRSADLWSERAIHHYGALIGRLHRVVREHPALAALDRPRWNDPVMLTFEHDLAGAEPDVLAYARDTLDTLERITGPAPTQLIHQDPHLANLHITEDDRITLFDFDDAAYGPVEYDLAMIVFYWIAGRRMDDVVEETQRLLATFLPAYEEEAEPEALDAELVDVFLTYRELDLYAAITGQHTTDPWANAFMVGREERVHDRLPFLGIPFSEV